MSPFLQTAIEAALAAQKVIQRYYRQEIKVELKEDQSPVTIADVETEKTIKAIITKAFPDHGFYGEETGHTRGSAPYT
ncbi:MAG: inositol monophosphatase, partial [Thioalkalivibrio sp.]